MSEFDLTSLEEAEEKDKLIDTSSLDDLIAKDKEADEVGSKLQRLVEVFGRGVLRNLDLPADLSAVLGVFEKLPSLSLGRAAGLPSPSFFQDVRPGGEVADAAGLAEPEGILETGALEAGAALGPGLGLVKFGKTAAKTAFQNVPKPIRNLVEQAATSPGKFIAAEETIATGGGIARGIAEEADVGPVGTLIAELSGALTTAGVMNVGKRVGGLAFGGLTEQFGKTRAAEFLQRRVADVEGSVKKLADAPAGLTSAQAAEDIGLLTIERGVKVTPTGVQRFQAAKNEANNLARAELEEVAQGVPQRARAFIEARVERISQAIDDRVKKAIGEANDQIATLPETTNTGQLSQITIDELDNALSVSRVLETTAWNNVNFNIQVNTTPLKNLVEELQGVGKARKALGTKLPAEIRELLQLPDAKGKLPKGAFGEFETAQEIQNFRSEILNRIRTEAGSEKPDRALLGIYRDLEKKALEILIGGEDIAAAFVSPGRVTLQGLATDALLLYRQALGTTKILNRKFFTGEIGKLMGFDTKGAKAVDPAVALDRILKTGPQGASNVRAFVDAVGPQQARNLSEEFIERTFAHQSQDLDGNLNIASATRYMKNHSEMLDEFPDVRDRLTSMIDLARRSDQAIKIGKTRTKSIQTKAKASLLLNTDASKIIPRLKAEKDPVDATRRIAQSLSKDADAAQGFKRMFIDDIFKVSESRAAGGLDQPLLRESAVRVYLRDNRKIMQAAGFSKGELDRLDTIANTLRKLELSSQKVGAGSDTIENLTALQSLVGRVGGASILRGLGFNTIQATGAGASLGQRIMGALSSTQAQKILEDAVFDTDLMRTLLMRPTRQNTLVIINRLRGHLANIGVDIEAISREEEAVPTKEPARRLALGL